MRGPLPSAIASRFERGTFTRGVAVLVSGAVGAQILNALAAPFLTRIYNPEEMGQLGLFMAYVSVASTAVTLRYEQAVVVASTHAVAARLARLAIVIVLPMGIALSTGLAALIVTGTAGFDSLPTWTPLLAAASVTGMGVSAVFRHWLIRVSRFDVIAGVNVVRVAGRGVTQIGLGVLGAGTTGLLVGDLVGRVGGLSRMVRAAWPRLGQALREPVAESTGQLARNFWRFPVAGVPSALINALAVYIPTPLLAATYGLAIAGYFALVQRVLEAPLLVLGSSVSDALLGRISKRARKAPERAERLFLRAALGLAVLALPMALLITLFAPTLFAIIFGPEWRIAGDFAVAMVPWYTVALIVAPLGRVVLVYRGQLWKLVFDVLMLTMAVATVTIAADRGADPITAVWYLSVGQAATYTIYFLIVYRLVRRSSRSGTPVGPMG